MPYAEFLKTKDLRARPAGIAIEPDRIHPSLFQFQRDAVQWAVKQGRAAIWFNYGLGKTRIQLEIARLIDKRALIIAPLSVASQTQREALELGYLVKYATAQREVTGDQKLWITNYEHAHKFDPKQFEIVILDESSILKSLDSKTRLALTKQWRHTAYRFCFTATPAPNDIKEIVNHAAFLGIMSRKECFATFFENEGGKQLKTVLRPAAEKPFYNWLSSWAMAMKNPSDLGYSDKGYELPALKIIAHEVNADYVPEGQLMFTSLKGVSDRARVQRETEPERVHKAIALANSDDEQYIIWHHLNSEGEALIKAVRGAVLVEGKMGAEDKTSAYEAFMRGEYRVLISKPTICGFGMNFQHSHKQIWVGINDSFEQFHQGVHRQYRFGQTKTVEVHVIHADVQQAIVENIESKRQQAEAMSSKLIETLQDRNQFDLQIMQSDTYQVDRGRGWALYCGDSCDPAGPLASIPDDSVHLVITSPPFSNRYAYTNMLNDLGNSQNLDQFMAQYAYQLRELYRVMMPGRNVAIHLQQIRITKRDTGSVGLIDFRGAVIRAFAEAGFVYYSDYTIDKNAQVQARRKHHVSLLYKSLETDSAKCGAALADHLLVFKKPGDNPRPLDATDIPRQTWNHWAKPVWLPDDLTSDQKPDLEKMTRKELLAYIDSREPVWYGIQEVDVVPSQTKRAKLVMEDQRHLCPLQLGFIERVARIWSAPNETVLDPFSGVGSVGYQTVLMHRQYIGIELNPNWHTEGIRNLKHAERQANQTTLFEWAEDNAEPDAKKSLLPPFNPPRLKFIDDQMPHMNPGYIPQES
jgi:DNA modification methylase